MSGGEMKKGKGGEKGRVWNEVRPGSEKKTREKQKNV
jgi:hypothetical protein